MRIRWSKLFAALGLLGSLWGLSVFDPPWAHYAKATGAVRIVRFYATTGAVESGESAKLCYGVENAKTVRISPSMPGVMLSSRGCIDVAPYHTTHYTIMAVGYDGVTAIRSLTLPVRAAPPMRMQTRDVAALARSAQGSVPSAG